MACVKRSLDGRGSRLRWLCWFAPLWVMGCAHAPRPPCDNPPPIYIVLKGSDRLNPDEKGRPLVTQVLILQVKGTAKLEGAEFSDLTTKPKEVLGEELLSINETTVEPSGTTTVGYRREAKATAVVIVANFRQPSGFSWRTTAKLPPVDVEKCPDQPVAPKDAPGPMDTVLTFSLEDVRVVNKTPPSKDDGK